MRPQVLASLPAFVAGVSVFYWSLAFACLLQKIQLWKGRRNDAYFWYAAPLS